MGESPSHARQREVYPLRRWERLEPRRRGAIEGNVWVVSLDLECFFDTANLSKLVQLLSDSLTEGLAVG